MVLYYRKTVIKYSTKKSHFLKIWSLGIFKNSKKHISITELLKKKGSGMLALVIHPAVYIITYLHCFEYSTKRTFRIPLIINIKKYRILYYCVIIIINIYMWLNLRYYIIVIVGI